MIQQLGLPIHSWEWSNVKENDYDLDCRVGPKAGGKKDK